MSLLLKQIFSFLQMLNSETGTNQLAWGLSFGFVLGFAPILSLQCLLVLILAMLFRIQLGAAFLSAFFFSFIAFLIDPLSDHFGRMILETESLRPIFVALYDMPIVPLTRFNNSIVMGSAAISFVLVIPGFFLFRWAIVKYRATVVVRFKGTKFWKAFSQTWLVKFYSKYNDLYG